MESVEPVGSQEPLGLYIKTVLHVQTSCIDK